MLSVKSDLPAVWNLISPPCPSLLIAFWGAGQSYSYREYSQRYDETSCLKNFPVPSLTLGDELTYLRLTQHFFPVEEIFQTFKIILGRNPSPNQKQADSFSTDLFPVQIEFVTRQQESYWYVRSGGHGKSECFECPPQSLWQGSRNYIGHNVQVGMFWVCDKAAGMPGLTHSIGCYFLSTRGDYSFLLF